MIDDLVRELPDIPGLPAWDAHDNEWNIAEVYRQPYVRIKYSLAKRLQPKRIGEIGVYSGIAAFAFLAACPDATYEGIDNLSAQESRGVDVITPFLEKVPVGRVKVHLGDSQGFGEFPNRPYDMFHVDADHSRLGTYNDVCLGWGALSDGGVLLVDNAHNMEVCFGIFQSLYHAADPLLHWRYFPDACGTLAVWKRPL